MTARRPLAVLLAAALTLPLSFAPAVAGAPVGATTTVAGPVASAAAAVSPAAQTAATHSGRDWALPLQAATANQRKRDQVLASAHAHDGPAGRLAATTTATKAGRFSLAAVSWSGASRETVTAVEVRVREAGRWGEWYELGVVDASDSAGARTRVGSEPVVAPGATGVAARVRTTSGRAPSGLRVDLVDPGTGPAVTASNDNTSNDDGTSDDDEVPEHSDDADGGLRPEIVTRAQWGAVESWARPSSRSTELKAMYVHHTVSTNSYTRSQVPGMLRSIYRYHTKSLGWPDVGYHFLVDKFGTIYEGRRGSIDELVVGAQAGGYNASTIGVSVIGSYHKSYKPRTATVAAITSILAWQAYRWGVDPTGKVKLRTATSSKSGTRWKPGTWTPALPVIRGHRDTNITACPGGRLQDALPSIRTAVKQIVDTTTATIGAAPDVLPAPAATPLTASRTPVSLAHKVPVTWKATAGAVSYDILTRTASHTGVVTAEPGGVWTVAGRTATPGYTLPVTAAHTAVIGVRAVDAYGRAGAVTVIGTTTRPMGRSAMVRSTAKNKRWSLVVNKKGYYRTEAFSTKKKGASITVRNVTRARSVWIIAPGATSFGRVRVYAGAKRVKTINLRMPARTKQRIIKVDLPGTQFSGTVKLVTVDKKLVRISALAFPR